MQNKSVLSMGNAVLLRLVIGWTYFSAFWRRLILENKLDPETAGYIGEKFNHFLPNALSSNHLFNI
jgi:thiosulfate dehydrogenase [quinone] large subunit